MKGWNKRYELPLKIKLYIAFSLLLVPLNFLFLILMLLLPLLIVLGLVIILYFVMQTMGVAGLLAVFMALIWGLFNSTYATIRSIFVPFFLNPPFESGILINLNQEQDFSLFITELCKSMVTRLPDSIVISADPVFYVQQGKLKLPFDEQGKGRVLVLGLPLLKCINLSQLKSIIAHELAHFTGSDTLYSSIVYPVYISLSSGIETNQTLLRKKNSPWAQIIIVPSYYIITRFFRLFEKINSEISRYREYRADHIAAVTCGRKALTTGLMDVISYASIFHTFLKQKARDFRPDENIYQAFSSDLDTYQKEYDRKLLEELNKKASKSDSHPGLSERIEYLDGVADRQMDMKNAAQIFFQRVEYETVLSGQYLKLLTINESLPKNLLSNANPTDFESTLEYATFLSRTTAMFIDYMICMGIPGIFLSIILHIKSEDSIIAALSVLCLFYSAIMEGSVLQATIGKKLMKIKVVNKSGKRLTLLNTCGRTLAKLISCISLGTGFLRALFDEKHQATHDFYAKTFVIKN